VFYGQKQPHETSDIGTFFFDKRYKSSSAENQYYSNANPDKPNPAKPEMKNEE
jgi:hypothetical protein